MEKRELEVMWNHHYGTGKAKMVWIDVVDLLDKENKIRKIYQIIDKEYNDSWFLVRDINEASYILKTKKGNEYSVEVMKKYKKKYEFYKVSTELIEIFDRNIYPIAFRLDNSRFDKYYNKEKNISSAFFRNYFTYSNGIYKVVREYRNKVEYEEFENELDALQWCVDFNSDKDNLLIKRNNLKESIYYYEY